MRAWILCSLVVSAGRLSAQQPAGATTGSLRVTAAIVGPNLTVKPVPLHDFRLEPTAGGGSIEFRTALDGTAQQALPPGRWHLVSVKPAEVDGKRYSWSLDTLVAIGQPLSLELTNANAVLDTSTYSPADMPTVRTGAPEV